MMKTRAVLAIVLSFSQCPWRRSARARWLCERVAPIIIALQLGGCSPYKTIPSPIARQEGTVWETVRIEVMYEPIGFIEVRQAGSGWLVEMESAHVASDSIIGYEHRIGKRGHRDDLTRARRAIPLNEVVQVQRREMDLAAGVKGTLIAGAVVAGLAVVIIWVLFSLPDSR